MADMHEPDDTPTPLLPFNAAGVPAELKPEKRWTPWEAVWLPEKRKWDKIPYRADRPEYRLSTAKPQFWSSYEDALEAYVDDLEGKFAGLGYLMTGVHGIVGYDIDYCVKDGVIEPWAQSIIDQLDTYTEFSPSGNGVRMFCLGEVDRDWTGGKNVAIECYSGHHPRFLTVTGQRLEGAPVQIRTVSSDLHNELMARYAATKADNVIDINMPDIPESLPDIAELVCLSDAVRQFLLEGEHEGDRSAMLHRAGVELYGCGLEDDQVFGLLVTNPHTMEIALDKRRQRVNKAEAYLWREHCLKAKPKARKEITAEDFEDVDLGEEGPDPEPVEPLPDAVARCLRSLARECELGLPEFCSEIGFDSTRCRNAINATVLNQSNSKFVVVTAEGDYRVFIKENFLTGLYASVGNFFNQNRLESLLLAVAEGRFTAAADIRRFVEANKGRISKAIIDYVTVERQFGTLSINVDVFAPRASIRLHDGCAHITFPHIPFDEGEVNPAVIADYKAHWPMLDAFLDLIVASRFAAARKKAYLWIRAESDWGKGALEAVLDTHGLVVSMSVRELEKLFDGGPVGRQMADFKRAWVLLFNEFKTAKSELKMLEQKIQFSPKNMPVCYAQLYLKLFTSAEAVESLVSEDSGVEDQFANRFSLIQPTGNLDGRDLFRNSKKDYLDSLSAYVGAYLNRRVEEYLSLGRVGAANRGDKFIEAYHAEYGISNTFSRLSSKVEDLCKEFLSWVLANYVSAQRLTGNSGRGMSSIERYVWEAGKVKQEHGEHILYLKTPKSVFAKWLEVEFNPSERGKLIVKSAEFKAKLPEAKKVRVGKYEEFKAIRVGAIPDPDDLNFED